jgi:hypothetical protein
MAFTRFHDDPARIRKQLSESSFPARYYLNTPGPGIDMPFYEDPHLRLQKWGANLTTNNLNVESDLLGLTRHYTRDDIESNDHKRNKAEFSNMTFDTGKSFVEETRASHPAWTFRDLEQSRWETPFLNPQANVEIQFPTNIQTRVLEKDHFVAKVPVFSYLSGN